MTNQVFETIVYEGRKLGLACEGLLRRHPRVVRVGDEEATASLDCCFSTACWRRYVGKWEIEGGRLQLNEILGVYRLVGSEPLFADWYSGPLRLVEGELIELTFGGMGSRFAKEIFLEIENGVVTRTRQEQNATEYEADGFLKID